MGCVLLPWTTGDVKHNGTSLTDRIVGYDTIDIATTFCDNTPTAFKDLYATKLP
jgi:hypothetical protein